MRQVKGNDGAGHTAMADEQSTFADQENPVMLGIVDSAADVYGATRPIV